MSPCFPGALGKMLELKGGRQFASLCEWPFHGELMLFPKVRVNCCWATAKGSLPSPSGGGNNAHVCHFLIPVEIAGLIFTAGKKKIPFGKSTPTPLKNSTFQIASLLGQVPGHILLCTAKAVSSSPMTQPRVVLLVPVGGDGAGAAASASQGCLTFPTPCTQHFMGVSRELF